MGNDSLLPLAILLLGVAAIAGFIAFRPWPATAGSKPIKAGSYVVEILQGHPPAASTPPDRAQQITEIENGLTAVLLIWAVTKVASSGIVQTILGAVSGLAAGGE
jgi:hypothetical protein